MVPPGLEPGTLTTWKLCDNQLHHETILLYNKKIFINSIFYFTLNKYLFQKIFKYSNQYLYVQFIQNTKLSKIKTKTNKKTKKKKTNKNYPIWLYHCSHFPYIYVIHCGVVGNMQASHVCAPGSIPGNGTFLLLSCPKDTPLPQHNIKTFTTN